MKSSAKERRTNVPHRNRVRVDRGCGRSRVEVKFLCLLTCLASAFPSRHGGPCTAAVLAALHTLHHAKVAHLRPARASPPVLTWT